MGSHYSVVEIYGIHTLVNQYENQVVSSHDYLPRHLNTFADSYPVLTRILNMSSLVGGQIDQCLLDVWGSDMVSFNKGQY